MNALNTTLRLTAAVGLGMMLAACSTPAEPEPSPEPAEETVQPTESPETEEQTPVNYNDPSGFEGFDAFIEGVTDNYEHFRDNEFIIGTTFFGEFNYPLKRMDQLADDNHEAIKDAETLEPGAFGKITTDYWTKTGGPTVFTVCNPAHEAAVPDDCIIAGITDLDGVTFSNGIVIGVGPADHTILERINAVLGEPAEITAAAENTVYRWCDQTGLHDLRLTVKEQDDSFEILSWTYRNDSFYRN